jgi:indoleamine 2,3-dioxygenase
MLPSSTLISEKELLRAHLVLSLIAHSYIVGFPKVDTFDHILPACIAVPWFEVSGALGLQPVVSYTSLELANYKFIDSNKPGTLENLAMLHTFSGSFDEAWFYLVPLAIENIGAPGLQAFLDLQEDVREQRNDRVHTLLETMTNKLNEMTLCLKRMYEKNDPHIFWHRVRPYSG